ncbi:MAG: methionyl-tRNA formyltransferase [Pirellulaceae bacterium]
MRIVMMGTGPFAVPTFEALLASRHEVPCLFTQPIRAMRGKRQPPPSPMRQVAMDRTLPIHDPVSVNTPEAHAVLLEVAADLMVVCDYGQILSRETLGLTTLGGINLHGSLLPKYRGAAPVNWAIYHGEPETGITVIHMTPKLDGGPALRQITTPIGPDEDAVAIEGRLSQLGVTAVLESIDLLEQHGADNVPGQVQDPGQVTQAPRLKKTDAEIDWNQSAQQIYNQFRAFQPWPGCYTHWQREEHAATRWIVTGACLAADAELENIPSAQPGTILSTADGKLLIATGNGALALTEIQLAGKKPLPVESLLCGYPIQSGQCLVREPMTE